MAVSPLLSQCATRADLEQVRYQLRIVNKKLEDMKATTVDQLQKRQALASNMENISRLQSSPPPLESVVPSGSHKPHKSTSSSDRFRLWREAGRPCVCKSID